ncbi:MmgE/PrpD family protein [Streptomyces sp. WMMB 322]|uniref:MmgE/PrpD family protein n=1 Tax=Streptomyces sp. WMMB 322 TaxID=1286821 RepID=UPI000823EE9C|nr:MmgE/PrpD family protein [Streptomyces sp. WMMB 322]SCK57338.1 2-methylcitrate dehydratase PrpD [Streptomyces sp. WMMB 322]
MIADLADWAAALGPDEADREVARRALVDTVAVTLAAAGDPVAAMTAGLPEPLRWAATGHVLDFDDVHLPSTSHVSVVCVNAALACGGGARAYLAGAGVMARLGTALGWSHYASGWHTTCTAGAPAAAVAAGTALGLDTDGLRRAMALAVPAAGGVQRAFGTSGKSLQVGFATDAGVRAARLAAAGATAEPAALDDWFGLAGGTAEPDLSGPAVPDGLALKLHPCCYAMQRPISAARELPREGRGTEDIERITVTTPEAGMQPLIHRRPRTGLEAKFSMEYAVATTLLDGFPRMADFTDSAAARPQVRELLERTKVRVLPGGEGGLTGGETRIVVESCGGERAEAAVELPRGHPERPASDAELAAKVADCVGEERAAEVMALTWESAAPLLRGALGPDRGQENRSVSPGR